MGVGVGAGVGGGGGGGDDERGERGEGWWAVGVTSVDFVNPSIRQFVSSEFRYYSN